MPFDAMKGLHEALLRQEESSERVERVELGEEDAAALSNALAKTARGDSVEVTFYRDGRYLRTSGTVTKLDEVKRILYLSDERISFDDIIEVKHSSHED